MNRSASMGYTIRGADWTDAELLADVIRRAFADVAQRFGLTPENCSGESPFITSGLVSADMEDGIVYYLLEEDGKACGCIAAGTKIPDVLYLKRLSVVPEYRRRGFGRALMHYAAERAKTLGKHRVEFGTMTENMGLTRWYEGQGFSVKETRRFEHLPFGVTFMHKTLE